ncbi:hypothetical protein [Parasphingopyxis sp.]|uniref:hypothetical protein n=1 Tax=Parasphingopyxis sp. TaxID=1920299 RepID=UPI00260D5C4C|nr:hypothetical protein [Parasphingopyxis sp.]
MQIARIRNIAFLAVAAAGLSGCTIYDGYGTGYYSDRYAGNLYPDECYDKDGYLYPECEDAAYVARNGYGYGSVFYNNRYGPYGWYDGFYYPGYSFYVYDRLGHRYRWRDHHRRHWEERRARRYARGQRREARREARREERREIRREERRAERRGERRENRRNRDGARNSYRGPYPPVTNTRPQRRTDSGNRGGRSAVRQAPARNTAPPARANTRSTRQNSTQRMRSGPRDTHPE